MRYYEKYLKYKKKYLYLKNQLGGDFNRLNTDCKAEIKNNLFNNCIHCYYQYNTINALSGKNEDILKPYTEVYPNKSFSVCIDHALTKKYFDINLINRMFIRNNITKIFDRIPINELRLLNPDNFRGIKSIQKKSTDLNFYYIKKYPTNIHTLCAEGNIVWVTKESKVGTTSIVSCMFVVILLNDESKICIHHNLNDIYEILNIGLDKKEYLNFSNGNNLGHIFENSNIMNENISKIFLIAEDFNDFNNLIIYYNTLRPVTQIRLTTVGNFIIDDNNDIIKIEEIRGN